MFGIGFPELILILIVALLVVGPSRLPQVARSVGKALGEFRRMADDVKETIEGELIKDDDKPDEPEALEGEPPKGGDAPPQPDPSAQLEPPALEEGEASAQHEPVPAGESEPFVPGEPGLPADEQDPHARKGP